MPRAPVVEPSSAPRSLGRAAESRSDDLRRRRGKKNCNSSGGSSSSTGSAQAMGDTSTPTGRRQKQQQQRQATSAAAAGTGANPGSAPNTNGRSTVPGDSRLRSPLERYLLLSFVLVTAGLAVRYLWRQLAGLVGAVLILSTARRWNGESSGAGESSHDAVPPGRGTGKTRAQGRQSSLPPAGRDKEADEGRSSGVGEATAGDGDGTSRGVTGFADAPAELRRYWEDGGPGCGFLVRGPKYLSDRKKV
ncbi:unnamed protein product, partial [Hapterophycus canaliculatus]